MNKNDVKTKCKNNKCISLVWYSSKCERNGLHAKLTWHLFTYIAQDLLRSYFDDCQKNEIYFLNIPAENKHYNGRYSN